MKKIYCEWSYVLGMISLALGASMMTKADFGLSMVIAPAYLLHLKLSEIFSFVTFGVAQYLFQAALLILLVAVVRRFKLTYLLSFVTAVIYGLMLDGCIGLMSLMGNVGLGVRLVLYFAGLFLVSLGVSFMFHTYISAEVYELFVKELSDRFGFKISNVKTVYDCISCVTAVVMSFCFFGFGQFEGVGWGTVICAVANGRLIGKIGDFLDKNFEFCDRFKLRKYF